MPVYTVLDSKGVPEADPKDIESRATVQMISQLQQKWKEIAFAANSVIDGSSSFMQLVAAVHAAYRPIPIDDLQDLVKMECSFRGARHAAVGDEKHRRDLADIVLKFGNAATPTHIGVLLKRLSEVEKVDRTGQSVPNT